MDRLLRFFFPCLAIMLLMVALTPLASAEEPETVDSDTAVETTVDDSSDTDDEDEDDELDEDEGGDVGMDDDFADDFDFSTPSGFRECWQAADNYADKRSCSKARKSWLSDTREDYKEDVREVRSDWRDDKKEVRTSTRECMTKAREMRRAGDTDGARELIKECRSSGRSMAKEAVGDYFSSLRETNLDNGRRGVNRVTLRSANRLHRGLNRRGFTGAADKVEDKVKDYGDNHPRQRAFFNARRRGMTRGDFLNKMEDAKENVAPGRTSRRSILRHSRQRYRSNMNDDS